MRILWISHGGFLSGAELCLAEAAKGLVSKGHQVHTLVPRSGPLVGRLEIEGSTVSIIPYAWWVHGKANSSSVYRRVRSPLSHFRASIRIKRLVMHEPPDLIVTNTLTVPAGALAAKWLCVPHIWYIHEFGREDHDLLFDLGNSTTAFLIDKLSNKVIVNSYAVLDKFRNYIPEHKLCVIYYGIEVPPQLKTDDIGSCNKVFRLIIVGQLCPGKRQEEAIKALSVLLRKGLNVRLTLLGYEHPEYGRTLRELVSELKVENQVEFIGQTPDPFKYVSDCHVALTCSGSEAFGRVTVEAMKLGKPVIGADNAGTAELIQDGVTGLLYRPGDAEDLARKVELLYHNPALAECISANARVWSNCTFTIENYVERLLSVFEEVIRAHQARRVKGRVAPDPID